jgi:hypothetical protein
VSLYGGECGDGLFPPSGAGGGCPVRIAIHIYHSANGVAWSERATIGHPRGPALECAPGPICGPRCAQNGTRCSRECDAACGPHSRGRVYH